jgi:hypothetical protein
MRDAEAVIVEEFPQLAFGRDETAVLDSSGSLGAAQGLAAIAERLGDMDTRHAILAVEVRKSAGDAQGPVIAARAQRERIGGVAQQREPGRLGRGNLLEQRSVALRVGAHADAAERFVARALHSAGNRDSLANLGASFRSLRQHEIGGRDRRHLDLQIDAVEHGSRSWVKAW